MEQSLISINNRLDPGVTGFVRFRYNQIKLSAELAAQKFGCEWAEKFPQTQEMIELKEKIRRIVLSQTPDSHSNRDVVWQRFRKYALNYCDRTGRVS